MQFATIKGLRIEKYTLQSQNWRESAKTNKTTTYYRPPQHGAYDPATYYRFYPPQHVAIDKALSTLSLVANCKPEVRAAVQLEASELWAISATLSDRLGPPHHLVRTPRVAPHLPPTWNNPSPQTTPSSTTPSSPPPEDKNGTSRKRKRQ
jgi:hypothetical protein